MTAEGSTFTQHQCVRAEGMPNSATAAVLAQLLPRWQHLLEHERWAAACDLLPELRLLVPSGQQAGESPRKGDDGQPGEESLPLGPPTWLDVGSRAAQLSAETPELSAAQLPYGGEDLLEALCRWPVQVAETQLTSTLLQAVRAPRRAWLQSFLAELQPDARQVGADDASHPAFAQQQAHRARQAVASGSAAACCAVARSGVCASERPGVWAVAMGLPHPCLPGDWQELQRLCQAANAQTLAADVLTCADAQHAACSSSHFASLEQRVRMLLLAFSRHTSIAKSAAAVPPPAAGGAETDGPPATWVPPSGVLPFQGLTALAAPLCGASIDDAPTPDLAYALFRALYCRFFCKLHMLSAHAAPHAGLAVLCRTFVDLLQEVDPDVHAHLGRLSASPLDLAFPWIVSAFSGHLAPAEVLLLWDRVVGFDSLLPLPVLAVAVMVFRRDIVLAALSAEELAPLLHDLTALRVVPLLQALLADA